MINFYATVTDSKFQNVWMKNSIKMSLLVLRIANRGKLYVILSSVVVPVNDCDRALRAQGY